VATGRNADYDKSEPQRVAEAIKLMGVKHAVITSVNRDELPDKGAYVWAETIRLTKELNPNTTMETLIPDFMTKWDLLYQVIDEKPEVVSHNMETVKRLYRKVRPQAKYERSLEQIQKTKLRGRRTKSGMMLGLGETESEVLEAMQHLVNHGCDVLTLGQYLQPTKMHLSIERFVTPDEFDFYKQEGLQMGFKYVESGPLVRSSYHAERHVI
jgi:lipoic acid synthetase